MIGYVLAFLFVLGAFTFAMLPLRRWGYLFFAIGYLAMATTVIALVALLLGQPRPAKVDFFTNYREHATVISAYANAGIAIYIWVVPHGSTEPVALVFPWNDKTAEELQDAMREGQATGSNVEMTLPALQGGFDEREPKFYAAPQEALPDKSTRSQ